MINLILVTHENLAESLLKTALSITGAESAGLKTMCKTARTDGEKFVAELKDTIAKNQDGTIILADLFGGSGANACSMFVGTQQNAILITGVNLNMVITFLHNRNKMPLERLAQKIEEDGKKGIVNLNCFIKAIEEMEKK